MSHQSVRSTFPPRSFSNLQVLSRVVVIVDIPEHKVDFRFAGYTRSRNEAIMDPGVVNVVDCYRAAVAKQIKAIDASVLYDIASGRHHDILNGNIHVSIKIDGISVFFVMDRDDWYFCNTPYHRIWTGLPVAGDVARLLKGKNVHTALLAGELFAGRLDDDGTCNWECRSKVDDIMQCQASPEDVFDLDRIGFRAIDIIMLDGNNLMQFDVPPGVDPLGMIAGTSKNDSPCKDRIGVQAIPYPDRLARLSALFPITGRAAVVPHHVMRSDQLASFFDSIVQGGHEGIVIRTPIPEKAFKVKPIKEIDAAVIGVIEDDETTDTMGGALLAVRRPTGQFVVIGQASAGMSVGSRKELWDAVEPADGKVVDLGKDGYMRDHRWLNRKERKPGRDRRFTMVQPSVVVQVRTLDIRSRDSGGLPITKPVLQYDPLKKKWSTVGKEQTPVLGTAWFAPGQCIRKDKDVVSFWDVRDTQFPSDD